MDICRTLVGWKWLAEVEAKSCLYIVSELSSSYFKNGIQMSKFSTSLGVPKGCVTQILKILEEKELLKRPPRANSHSILVSLIVKGKVA